MSRQHLVRPARAAVAIAAFASLATVTACGAPGASSEPAATTAATSAAISTQAPTSPVTITLYDGQGLKGVDDALIAAFTKKYPNVTVKATYDPDNVTTQNQPRQLAAAEPPDLIRVISVSSGVKNGLLTNLDPYAAAYGWDKLPASQLAQFRAKDGVAGSGNLYAKPTGFTMTGLYYDKANAAKIGMTNPPASVEELTALMAKAKSAGLVPMVVHNKEGGGVFPFQLLLNSMLGPDKVAAWVFNAPDATIDTPEAVKAAQQVADWNKAGYFPDGVNGLDANAADALFASGKAVFFPWGNWDAANIDKTLPGKAGFIPMPPATAGGQVGAMSDAATAFGIPAKAKNKDAAALFLDFLSSDEARQIAVDNGFMPSGTDDQAAPTIPAGSVKTDVVAAFKAVSAAGGQTPFVQNATAGISNQAWNPETQLLLGGKSDPQKYVANIQAKYASELGR
ncbi:ABC transporter substrate-binding protein [Kineosporia sp. R_H_3]|uniref:ABC transporter substrate-binding protein n=1 Tax=Kineosporia sp. R_H_3 TaxID=1961848 RepID=UPI000B4BA875|nr:extracellular solute-binding protein [Kineosporia sp. R_H_3]